MKIFIKLFRESFIMALHEIAVNKVRTLLSLLGITIGIFSIISVFTIFDSMEREIKESISTLGNDVLFVQKWPWAMGGGDFPWWKYFKRQEPDLADLKEIQKRSEASQASAFVVNIRRTVKYGNNSIENCQIGITSEYYPRVIPIDISNGRYISTAEFISGKNVTIIGHDVARNLFGDVDPIGKRIKIFGTKTEVVGVIKKEGTDTFGDSPDDEVMVPVNFARAYVDFKKASTVILVKARPGVSIEELKDELTGIMRAARKLKPRAEDDFAINEIDLITEGFKKLFSIIAWVGWIIGGFSLLVGGFGIANIMFVSVKERTRIIGIQKAMGAKNYFILLQFLIESVFLSLFGGVVGLIIVFLLTLLLGQSLDMNLVLTQGNIILGLGVSALIGFASGLIPAWSASHLDPVEAMRSTF